MQQYIGIDVGGTHVKYGVINSDGEELTHHQFDTPEDASTFTRKWQDVVARCQQDYDIAAIGVSFPGHINPHNGHAAKAGALAYLDDVNLMELFSGLTDLKRLKCGRRSRCRFSPANWEIRRAGWAPSGWRSKSSIEANVLRLIRPASPTQAR